MTKFIVISVFVLLSVSTIVAGWGNTWGRQRIRFPIKLPPKAPPKPAPTKPPAFSPAKDSRYCDESKISKLLSGRKKRALPAWPYDCTYASIVRNNGRYQFMYNIYSCCNKCDFPTYSTCMSKHVSPNWRCPSDGVHCLVDCIKEYGPGSTTILVPPKKDSASAGWGDGIKTQGNKPVVKKVPKKLNCDEKVEKLPNGKTCIRRLCVTLNL